MKYLKVIIVSIMLFLVVKFVVPLLIVGLLRLANTMEYKCQKEKSFKLNTSYGDEFLVKYQNARKASLTDDRKEYKIYYLSENGEQLVYRFNEKLFQYFEYSYADAKVRAYSIQLTILFKLTNEKKFRSVPLDSYYLRNHDYLVPIVIQFLKDDEIDTVKYVAKYLIDSNIPLAKKAIEDCAKGNFSEKQKQNMTDEDLQDLKEYCMKLLVKKR